MVATLQVRDVPDDIAQIIVDNARHRGMSQAAYVREVLTKAHETDRKRRAMREGLARIDAITRSMDLSRVQPGAGAQAVRDVRDDYDRDTDAST